MAREPSPTRTPGNPGVLVIVLVVVLLVIWWTLHSASRIEFALPMLADVIPAMVTALGALLCFRSRWLEEKILWPWRGGGGEPEVNFLGQRIAGGGMFIGGVYYFVSKYSGWCG